MLANTKLKRPSKSITTTPAISHNYRHSPGRTYTHTYTHPITHNATQLTCNKISNFALASSPAYTNTQFTHSAKCDCAPTFCLDLFASNRIAGTQRTSAAQGHCGDCMGASKAMLYIYISVTRVVPQFMNTYPRLKSLLVCCVFITTTRVISSIYPHICECNSIEHVWPVSRKYIIAIQKGSPVGTKPTNYCNISLSIASFAERYLGADRSIHTF